MAYRERRKFEGSTLSNSNTLSKKNKIESLTSKKMMREAYGVQFPQDFFDLWEFCQEINEDCPRRALIPFLQFELVGPYEVLSKEIIPEQRDLKLHLHWRFYYDPPEFMTTIISTHRREPTYHVGYWRDDPRDEKCVVAHNGGDNWAFALVGDNVFSEIRHRLACFLRTSKNEEKKKLENFQKSLHRFVKAHCIDMESEHYIKHREKSVICSGFHGAGLVVPVDKNQVGYRPVGEDVLKLVEKFKNIDEAVDDDTRKKAFNALQETITFVQLANDECDFGMGLEFGMSMFCYGSRYLNKAASRMLSLAYSLLKRDLFKRIIESHISDRRIDNFSRFPWVA